MVMDIFRVIGIALVTTFAIILLKPTKPEVAALVSVIGGILVIMLFVESLQTIIENIARIVQGTGIRSELFSALIRIIGIGYLTEFASNICDEAGNSAMARKVTIAGKILILILALPIINNLIDVVVGVLPS